MEKYSLGFIVLLLVEAVGCVIGAVPSVEVTKLAAGNCVLILAEEGDSLTVKYEGSFLNGTIFESSFEKNETFTFNLGNPSVIKGWNKGLQGACVGDELKLLVPHSLSGKATKPFKPPPLLDVNYRIRVVAIEDVHLSPSGNITANGNYTEDSDGGDESYDGDPDVEGEPYDPSGLLYKLQFLAIPVAVILLILVAYCIYTIEFPDRKIKFYRVSDHDSSSSGLNRVI